MPKEITHWILAQRTAEALRDTRLGDAALACPNALKLGAVFPDMAYYLTGKTDLAALGAKTARAYHGSHGQDTYILPRALLTRALSANPTEDQIPRLAFLTGVAAHLHADMAFHPLVFYLTGNTQDPDPARRTRAVRKHRQFETLLDIHVCGSIHQVRTFRAKYFLDNLELPFDRLMDWAPDQIGHPDAGSMLHAAVKRFCAAQKLFIHPAAAVAARFAEPLIPDKYKELTALIYRPGPEAEAPRLDRMFTYQNPVSGEPRQSSIQDLLHQAVKNGVAMCTSLESALRTGDATHFSQTGPSLISGLVGTDISEVRFLKELEP
jgi:hypothetical protein